MRDDRATLEEARPDSAWARCVWQGIAVVAALVAWSVFADDFATGMLAATVAYFAASTHADRRHGPLTTPAQARQDVLDLLHSDRMRVRSADAARPDHRQPEDSR